MSEEQKPEWMDEEVEKKPTELEKELAMAKALNRLDKAEAAQSRAAEVVGAVPVGYVSAGRLRDLKEGRTTVIRLVHESEAVLDDAPGYAPDIPVYTAPPSTAPKAQDDLAGAGVEVQAEIAQLMKFYGADTLEAVVLAQNRQIEGLQARLPRDNTPAFQRVREG